MDDGGGEERRGEEPPVVRRMIERPARPPEDWDAALARDAIIDPNRIS